MTFTIENSGTDTVVYNLSNVPTIGMYVLYNNIQEYSPASFPNPMFAASADLVFSQNHMILGPGERAIITVSPSPPSGVDLEDNTLSNDLLPVYSGYIPINGSNGDNMTIPYLGLTGNLYDADNLDPVASSTLGCTSEGHEYDCDTSNLTFTMPYPSTTPDSTWMKYMTYEYPKASITLNLGSALIRVDVIPQCSNYSGPTTEVFGDETAGSVYGFPMRYHSRFDNVEIEFTGMLADGTVVPAGKYALAVRVLKLFWEP